jgi:RNA polymerase sigma-70 factor (ECF subfamily)
LGTTEGTIAVTVNRMRRRYLELLRAVILQTVRRPEEVEEELRHLLRVLRG